jgi:hypothetical protein
MMSRGGIWVMMLVTSATSAAGKAVPSSREPRFIALSLKPITAEIPYSKKNQVVMNLAQQLVHEVQHVSPDTFPSTHASSCSKA